MALILKQGSLYGGLRKACAVLVKGVTIFPVVVCKLIDNLPREYQLRDVVLSVITTCCSLGSNRSEDVFTQKQC